MILNWFVLFGMTVITALLVASTVRDAVTS